MSVCVPVSPMLSLSVAYGEGRWGTLLCEESRWLGEVSALNRIDSKSAGTEQNKTERAAVPAGTNKVPCRVVWTLPGPRRAVVLSFIVALHSERVAMIDK